MGNIVGDNIYLETIIQLDGPNVLVRHSDDTVTVSSAINNSGVDEDTTPHESDFRVDKISEPPEDKPTGVPSKVDNNAWPTPSALKKGHSSQDTFEAYVDMDSDSNLESEWTERNIRERGKYNVTTSMVCLAIFWFIVR